MLPIVLLTGRSLESSRSVVLDGGLVKRYASSTRAAAAVLACPLFGRVTMFRPWPVVEVPVRYMMNARLRGLAAHVDVVLRSVRLQSVVGPDHVRNATKL